MNIRRKSCLSRVFAGPEHPIEYASPEVQFMQAVCSRDFDKAVSFFEDTKLFSDQKSAVDTPYGRFEGISGIRAFAEGFAARFNATDVFMTPVIQTISGGRIALEAEFNFIVDGEIDQVPMFVIADLRTKNSLDEIRLYCHFSFVPGLQAYRHPMFETAHREMGDPGLLTGAPREYYEAIHHVPKIDVERVLRCCSDKCRFGGYHPVDADMQKDHFEDISEAYKRMGEYIPRCVGMRYETVIDDGKTCVLEWVHIVSRDGREERNRIALSGIAAYERGDDGKLCSIRISDYAGYENTIDWSQLDITKEEAQAVNFVETFPAGCGRKKQA